MGHRIFITARAERDLKEIHRYIAIDDARAAQRVYTRLIEQLKLTSDFSQAGRKVPELKRNEIRELIRSPYRIIYRLDRSHQSIQVLRFWHAARGTPRI